VAIFDFDGTLAEETLHPTSSPEEQPAVLQHLLTHDADKDTEIFIITGRHRLSKPHVVRWIKQTTGIDFPVARILTRWDIDPANGPASKVANLRTLITKYLPQLRAKHDPGKCEVVIYDNDRLVLSMYYALLHPMVPKVRFCLNWVSPNGKVEDVTADIGAATIQSQGDTHGG
jgi:hypothetical protein